MKKCIPLTFEEHEQLAKEERIRMPPPLSYGPYKKKNCWICWLLNENQEIYSIEIYETSPDQPRRVYEYLKFRLGKKPYRDVGNCLAEWDKWTLTDLLHKFGFQIKWESHDVKIKFLVKLGEIEEFSEQIKGYLKYHQASYC